MSGISNAAVWAEGAAEARLDGSASELRAYRDRPVEFARDVLGERYWASQRYVIEAVYKHHRVTHRSARKTGKTYSSGGLVLNFGSTGPATIITTAPTGRQVREYLWGRSIRRQFGLAKKRGKNVPGRMLTTAWRIEPDWFAIGFSTDKPENFLGVHADIDVPADDEELDRLPDDPLAEPEGDDESVPLLDMSVDEVAERAAFRGGRLLVVLDEAPGIDPMLYEMLEGSLSGENTYVLQQGNPLLDANSPHPFARSHQPGSSWHRVHTSGFTPEPGEDDVGSDKHFYGVPAYIMPPKWMRARLKEWGRESSAFRGHVGGMFGRAGMSSSLVVSRTLLEVAEARQATSPQGRHLGVDIAATSDQCVGSLWVDGVKCAQHAWREANLMKTADLIVTLAKKWNVPGAHIHMDATGGSLGVGVFSRLEQMGFFVDAVDFGGAAKGDWPELFGETRPKNRRAELHWIYRRMLEEGLGHLPSRWSDSWAQAMWATHEIRQDGGSGSTLVIEKKKDIIARYGRSPDHWDSDILAWSRSSRVSDPRVMRR